MTSNFFDDIFTLMNENNDVNNDKKTCLISQEPLLDEHITLECGHKFNYLDILTEVIEQKQNKNKCETQRLKLSQLKCPYCRNIQNKLLPQRECDEKIYGVNSPSKYCMYTNKCIHIFLRGARKGLECLKPCNSLKCKTHLQNNKKKCEGVLKSDNTKKCSKYAKDGSIFCSIHEKKIC